MQLLYLNDDEKVEAEDDDDEEEDEEGVTEEVVDFPKKLRIESFSWTVEWLVLEVNTLS